MTHPGSQARYGATKCSFACLSCLTLVRDRASGKQKQPGRYYFRISNNPSATTAKSTEEDPVKFEIVFIVLTAVITSAPVSSQATDRVLFPFEKTTVGRQWRPVNDGVMGGRSEGRFKITNDNTMKFFGRLSLANNGGFASVRSPRRPLRLVAGDTIVFRARGDGREYCVNLYTSRRLTAFSYRAPFKTKKNQWVTIRVPLNAFEATSFGRVLRNRVLDPGQVNGIGILLADKKAGDFKLEVDRIQVHSPLPLGRN